MTEWHGYDEAARSLCVNAFGEWHTQDLWKHNEDLRRYDQIIRDTQPDIIIETGTNTGASASWFLSAFPVNPKVITIDIEPNRFNRANDYGIIRVAGDSTHPEVGAKVRELLHRWASAGDGSSPRVMVSLDSDHSAEHVRKEIELYAPLVTPGCYLVIEDGVFSWLNDAQWREHGCVDREGNRIYTGTPLDAIKDWRNSGFWPSPFTRDREIEAIGQRPTMNPAGWWRRDA